MMDHILFNWNSTENYSKIFKMIISAPHDILYAIIICYILYAESWSTISFTKSVDFTQFYIIWVIRAQYFSVKNAWCLLAKSLPAQYQKIKCIHLLNCSYGTTSDHWPPANNTGLLYIAHFRSKTSIRSYSLSDKKYLTQIILFRRFI